MDDECGMRNALGFIHRNARSQDSRVASVFAEGLFSILLVSLLQFLFATCLGNTRRHFSAVCFLGEYFLLVFGGLVVCF